jgi:hypothetical protein
MGLKQPRLRGDAYYEVVDEFVAAVMSRWPKAVLQVGGHACLRVAGSVAAVMALAQGGCRLALLPLVDSAVLQPGWQWDRDRPSPCQVLSSTLPSPPLPGTSLTAALQFSEEFNIKHAPASNSTTG